MQVKANVQPVIKDFSVTLTPAEVDALRRILSNHLNNNGGDYWFTVDLRNSIDDAKSQASKDDPSDPTVWFASGKGDGELRAGRKIYAIKACREATGCGLKEAKDAADARARQIALIS